MRRGHADTDVRRRTRDRDRTGRARTAGRPYAAAFRALIVLAAGTGVGIECVQGGVPV